MIIIHAAGNSDIGIGNLARTAYLSEYLADIAEVILLWETDTNTADFFNQCGVARRIIVPNRCAAFEMLEQLETAQSIYITDLLELDDDFGEKTKHFAFKKSIHINDSLEKGYLPDILIDEDPFDKDRFNGRDACYFGLEYKIFRKDALSHRPTQANSIFKNILISFGGSDPAGYTEKTAEIVGKNNIPNISFVLGPLVSPERKLLCRKFAKYSKFYEGVNNLAPLIASYDVVISLGGITAYESALLGKAAIAIKWGHMAFYAENLGKLGMLLCLEDIAELEHFLLYTDRYASALDNVALNGFNMVQGTGGFKIANIIRNVL